MTNDFSKFKEQTLTRPMDAAWENFAKFEKVGDKVTGILRDVFYRPEEGMFKAQRGFTLEQEDGKLVNVSIKRAPYFAIRSTDGVKLGDLLTVALTELRKSKTAGFNPTKIFTFTAGTLKENEGNETVKELEAKDMEAVGAKQEDEVEEESAGVPFN